MSTKIIVVPGMQLGEFEKILKTSPFMSSHRVGQEDYLIFQSDKVKITQIVKELKSSMNKEMSKRFDVFLKSQWVYRLDSQEELWFLFWCLEAKNSGIIDEFQVHPEPYNISEKHETHCLKIPKWSVGIDFRITCLKGQGINLWNWIEGYENEWREGFGMSGWGWDIDIKPSFQSVHSRESDFKKNQAVVWSHYGRPINPVYPENRRKKNSKGQYITTPGFFQQTWVPEYCRYTPKTKELCRKWDKCISIEEWLRKGKQSAPGKPGALFLEET